MPNGTIRLYSDYNVWELLWFEVLDPKARDMVVVKHNGHQYGTVAQKLDHISSEQYFPHGEGKGFKKPSITFIHSFATTIHQKSKENNQHKLGTFLFEVPQNYHHWYDNDSRTYRLGVFDKEYFPVHAAFVLHFDGRQVMFADLGGELYLQDFPILGPAHFAKFVKDKNKKYSVGTIPSCLNAAFTLEFTTPTSRSWVVLIRCVQFCVVPFIDGKIRFDKV